MTTQNFESISYVPDNPIIVTAYTVDSHLGNYYQKAVLRLTRSCTKFNLPHIVFPLIGSKDWIHGCNLKPTVILHALTIFNKPILWLDADAQIFKKLDKFINPSFDMALVSGEGNHWLSGTLYCSPKVKTFIENWKHLTAAKQNIADELTLRDLFYNSREDRPSTELLPLEYNTVIHSETDIKTVTIGHYIREDIAPIRGVKAVPLNEQL